MKRNILIKAPAFSAGGYGAHARDIILAIWESHQFNISLILTGWGGNSFTDDISIETHRALDFMAQNKLQNPKEAIYLQVGLPNEFETLGEVNIGVTAGLEATQIRPDWVPKCNEMDMLIVPSEYIKALFLSAGVTTEVMVVHEGVDCDLFRPLDITPEVDKLELPDLGTKFNFLCGGQWLAGNIEEDRKQIGYLVNVLASQYSNSSDVGLYLKTYSANFSSPDNYFTQKRLQDVLMGRKFKVCLLHGSMSDRHMMQLYNHPKVNAFISLTSGEGWGRYVAEAAACGLPVLVPKWSGYMDFIDPTISCTFDIVFREIPQFILNQGLFQRGMKWAFVEGPEALSKIKYFIDNYNTFKEKACNYSKVMQEKFNKNSTYNNMVKYLISCKLPDIPLKLVKM